ncbi:hypothetical protein J6590_096959 [Homalodisca vitripennis]|nr:hypothetical protein J6590_096959 [Homalodisca vitripennis]
MTSLSYTRVIVLVGDEEYGYNMTSLSYTRVIVLVGDEEYGYNMTSLSYTRVIVLVGDEEYGYDDNVMCRVDRQTQRFVITMSLSD